jgi:hypothetical protein
VDRSAGRDEDLLQVLGYLHLSSGKSDLKTLAALNRLYGWALASRAQPPSPYAGLPAVVTLQHWLRDRWLSLKEERPFFRETNQAELVLDLVWGQLLPAYMDFHHELLFHQEPEGIFNGFFLGRAIEAVLGEGGPWEDTERIVTGAIRRLNDFIGYRPIAVLEGRRHQPYEHEWVRPIPLYIEGAGVAHGPYHEIITRTLEILRETDPAILQSAHFSLEHLDELAVDPRAYDFDHPVNKRPNYHFGQWDPTLIDLQGNYRRFVIQQVTLDALMARVLQERGLPARELVYESAAVLAGTMLMASCVSGSGPSTYSSTTTLASLMTPIAQFRDAFYTQLLERMTGPHADRLREEAAKRRQPLGGVRQHLNTQLARLRASQLAHVHLARLFARMGSPLAAKEESDDVPVPSARTLCRIDCLLTIGNQALKRGDLEMAVELPDQISQLIRSGIECGALVDPWNILGFAGNFSRFHGPDSAVHDHRIDELVQVMELVFSFLSRLWREAAASNHRLVCERVREQFQQLAQWWRQYAAHEVGDIQATDPQDSFESAELVAKALQLWQSEGAASGDVRFWAAHAEMFGSPKAYALVIEALLERNDFVGAMALLVYWLSQAHRVGLQSGMISFSELACQWIERLDAYSTQPAVPSATGFVKATTAEMVAENPPSSRSHDRRWNHIQRFFAYVEANGEEFLQPPRFQLGRGHKPNAGGRGKPQPTGDEFSGGSETGEEDEEREVFGAAYEDVVYQDSTDDGQDASLFEEESDTQDELIAESKRLGQHLTFLNALAQMWKRVALHPISFPDGTEPAVLEQRLSECEDWARQAALHRTGLLELVQQIAEYQIQRGGADADSMSRYDRKRVVKESLLERAIATAIEMADARRMLVAAILSRHDEQRVASALTEDMSAKDRQAVKLFACLMAGRRSLVEEDFAPYLQTLRDEKLLYVPLARGGDPIEIYRVRLRRRSLSHLLTWLPRQGMFYQAIQLVDTARHMEHHNPVGPGAVTEFDEIFQIAYESMVRCLVRNAYAWDKDSNPWPATAFHGDELEAILDANLREPKSRDLMHLLEKLTEVMLNGWLAHSRTLRLSILETVDNASAWKNLVRFIEDYGAGLFTQTFLKLSNVRAILHQGVGAWLERAAEQGDESELQPILEAIAANRLDKHEAQRWLTVVLEGVIDHYPEYRDYNSTTTQSDRGEMLYMLLDFLRLRVRYERVCWNLKPIFWAHEVLVRGGCHQIAQQWRRALAERVGREADQYLLQLVKLQEQYAMKMPTVADRLGERFLIPMTIDRMRALVRPAMIQLRSENGMQHAPAFDLLVQETRLMTREPIGVGLDVPAWLSALEEEVERVLDGSIATAQRPRYESAVPTLRMTVDEIESQLTATAKRYQTRSLPQEKTDGS